MPPHPLFYGTFQYIHPFHYHLHENSPLVMAQNQSTSRRIPHPIDQRLVIEETKVHKGTKAQRYRHFYFSAFVFSCTKNLVFVFNLEIRRLPGKPLFLLREILKLNILDQNVLVEEENLR